MIRVYRSPEDAQGAAEADPFAVAAAGVEAPKYPVLAADRIVQMVITKATVETVKEDVSKAPSKQRKMLVLAMKTTKDYPDKDGKPLRAGFSGFKRIGLFEVKDNPDKRDRTIKDNILPELSEVLRCCGMGQRTSRELLDNPSIIVKSLVDVKTSINSEKGGFPESNGFKFVPPQ